MIQNASVITAQLAFWHQKLSEDVELSKLVPYRIQKRGQADEQRFSRLQNYQGPDWETLSLLNDNHQYWLQEPALFWNISPSSLAPFSEDPQAHIIGRYLETFGDNA